MVISLHSSPIPNSIPPAGSKLGAQTKQYFVSQLKAILGDIRYLWMPALSETTASTDLSRYAQTITYDATFAAQYSSLGSGVVASFNGSTDYASSADSSNMTFGSGTLDYPFSIWAIVNQTATATIKTILARYDLTTGVTNKEWYFAFGTDEKLYMQLFDDSANAYVGRYYNTALTAGSTLCVSATYDGGRTSGGIRLYSAGAAVDDTDNNSGTYVAMENKAGLTYLGATESTAGAVENLFNGSMACVALTSKELTIEEQQALYSLARAYYNF